MQINDPINTMSGFDSMLASMGVDMSGAPTTDYSLPDDDTTTVDTTAEDVGADTTIDTPATTPGSEDQNQDTVPEDTTISSNGQNATKNTSNSAFAELRVKNKEATDALEAICAAAGMDPALARNPKQILQMLEDANTTKQAQELNVPPVLLKRMNELEKKDQMREANRLSELAMKGFNAVKEKYKLTDSELKDFSKQLQEKGVNPFEKEIDLEREYCFANLPKILEKTRKEAYAEAQAKDQKAQQHSTTPAAAVGKKDEPSEPKINTMAQFDKFISSLSK